MIRTQIQLDEKQFSALKAKAAEERVSVASLVRRGIAYLLESSSYPKTDERRQRALDAAGRFHSGTHDLSIKHDTYLDESWNP